MCFFDVFFIEIQSKKAQKNTLKNYDLFSFVVSIVFLQNSSTKNIAFSALKNPVRITQIKSFVSVSFFKTGN